jgi:hypothetical protein
MFYIFYIIKKIDKVSITLSLSPYSSPPISVATPTTPIAPNSNHHHHRNNLTPRRCRNSLSTPPLQQPHTSTLPELAVHAAPASRRLTVPSLSPSLSGERLASRLSRYASPLSELFGFIFFRFKGSHLTVFLPVASQCIFFCLGSTRAGD